MCISVVIKAYVWFVGHRTVLEKRAGNVTVFSLEVSIDRVIFRYQPANEDRRHAVSFDVGAKDNTWTHVAVQVWTQNG